MKRADIHEVRILIVDLERIEHHLEWLATVGKVSIATAELGVGEEIDADTTVGKAVVLAFRDYLEWRRALIEQKLRELGVEP
jgi:hypothetical protein